MCIVVVWDWQPQLKSCVLLFVENWDWQPQILDFKKKKSKKKLYKKI
jgi:hypothetical protein